MKTPDLFPQPAETRLPAEPDVVLVLRPLRREQAASYRLRGALKVLLRRYGFKCVKIVEPPVNPQA